ncbi:hypothetical protein EJ07DRAFT_164389 [Lizonia empirigonia]|nr:hypothetical protein EJ07DRAFT_164389 [Lizonia empirigonia]
MEYNALINLGYGVQGQLWVDKGTFYYGAFNAGLKMVFPNGTAWMVRFPRVGKVHDCYADEKVAMEVKALSLIREGTTIPVPKVHAWGFAAGNPLGLGPFIIMDFVDGVSLNDLLKDPNAERSTRLMREDIDDKDVEFIYRQCANSLLQLFKLDFDQIGSLPSPRAEAESPLSMRPLTFKAHSILQSGGVNTFGDRHQGFATTTESFQYIAGQDLEQLIHQPNSVDGPYDAKTKLKAFKALKSLIPDFINPKYDRGKFKLICDDLGLANLIVRSKENLTVVGVVDLEWSYIGPAQLFGSAPWWLLQDRPVNSAWDCNDDEPPKIASRYLKYLEIFKRVLGEEETKMLGHEEKELSSLVKWSQDSGAMWLHMLLSLRQHLGSVEWNKHEKEFDNAEELDAFAARKVHELEEYDDALEKAKEIRAFVDSGKATKEEFIATLR